MDRKNQGHPSPYDPPTPLGSPHGAPPNGAYESASAQEPPYLVPSEQRPRRGPVRTVLGIVCLILGGLFILGALANLVLYGAPSFRVAPGHTIGYLMGNVLIPGAFIFAGVLLLRRPKR